MAARLLVAPPATGKTQACAERVCGVLAERPLATVWAVLPDLVQTRHFRRRVAASGGAIGLHVGTFQSLYRAVLDAAGESVPVASDPIRRQVVRAAVDEVLTSGGLAHYGPIGHMPGFVAEMASRIAELKRARVEPDAFLAAAHDDEPLTDLGRVYDAYQRRLLAIGWADPEGLAWLAVAALERDSELVKSWALVVVDGFDSFVAAQRDVLAAIAQRPTELVVTLPGDPSAERKAHRRFAREVAALSPMLGAGAESLDSSPRLPDAVAHIERELFASSPRSAVATCGLELKEARAPADEAREALRWLKARHVRDDVPLVRMAVITPDPETYRPHLREAASEMGVPLHFTDGEALAKSTPIAALLDLLTLPMQRFPRRLTVEAIRTPYLDLAKATGLSRRDADALEAVSRAARVVEGIDQWIEALDLHVRNDPRLGIRDDEEAGRRSLPVGDNALRLRNGLRALGKHLAPGGDPPAARHLLEWVAWLEDLLDDLRFARFGETDDGGEGPSAGDGPGPSDTEPEPTDAEPAPADAEGPQAGRDTPKHGPPAVRDAPEHGSDLAALERRDRAAFLQLRETLRALAMAEQLGVRRRLGYAAFVAELSGALETTQYRERGDDKDDRVLVTGVLEARGPRFDSVAIVGLSEGLLPQVEREDPFLGERIRMELGLEGRLDREQRGLFYLAATRADERLLLTRPYLADDGQPRASSPYWRAVCGLFTPKTNDSSAPPEGRQQIPDGLVVRVQGDEPRPVVDAASTHELLVWSVRRHALPGSAEGLSDVVGERWPALRHARDVLAAREARLPQGPHEGALAALAPLFAEAYGPGHVWSPSRLESYGSCPMRFLIESVMHIEADAPPELGLDARQLGTMLHEILEHAYAAASDPTDPDAVLESMQPIADAAFESAPERLAFRPTALWSHEQEEYRGWLEATVRGLAEMEGTWRPHAMEAVFGIDDEPPLVADTSAGPVSIRGVVDRVDWNARGQVRVLDYKTGSRHLAKADLVAGVRLQLPIYALAARDALGQGEPIEGLYWSIRAAKAGSLRLSKFVDEVGADGATGTDGADETDGAAGMDGTSARTGVQGAVNVALTHVARIVTGVRAGNFEPRPARGECPSYCAAAAWCWRYTPSRW